MREKSTEVRRVNRTREYMEEEKSPRLEWNLSLCIFVIICGAFYFFVTGIIIPDNEETVHNLYERNKNKIAEEQEKTKAIRLADIARKTKMVSANLGLPESDIVHASDTIYGEVFFTPMGMYKAEYEFIKGKQDIKILQKVDITSKEEVTY